MVNFIIPRFYINIIKMRIMKGGKMGKIVLLLILPLLALSFALAAEVAGQANSAGAGLVSSGQEVHTTAEVQTQNQGNDTSIQTQSQERVQTGSYVNSEGKEMKIQTENGFRLQVGNSEASSSLSMVQERSQNRTTLRAQLSNGQYAEIKIMPDTASETAIARLQLRVCSLDNNCSIELKETGTGNQTRAVYEVQAEKQARLFGVFATNMTVQAQVDAENGSVTQVKKPWWAFLATESSS